MNKLSLDALRQRAEAVASEDVLATISGGLENSCHDAPRSLQNDLQNLPAQPSTPTVNVPNPPPPGNTSSTIRVNI